MCLCTARQNESHHDTKLVDTCSTAVLFIDQVLGNPLLGSRQAMSHDAVHDYDIGVKPQHLYDVHSSIHINPQNVTVQLHTFAELSHARFNVIQMFLFRYFFIQMSLLIPCHTIASFLSHIVSRHLHTCQHRKRLDLCTLQIPYARSQVVT